MNLLKGKEGEKGGKEMKWLAKLKKIKHIEWILAAVIGAVILLIYFSPASAENTNAKTDPGISLSSGSVSEQEELERVLAAIKGAGKVRVMISYASGPELEPAMDYDKSINTQKQAGENSSSETSTETERYKPVTVYQNGVNEALILVEKKPEIRGVIVIAEGAGSVRVQMNLLDAVKTVLNIEANKVNIFEMQTGN